MFDDGTERDVAEFLALEVVPGYEPGKRGGHQVLIG
jgi:hypothetical protein